MIRALSLAFEYFEQGGKVICTPSLLESSRSPKPGGRVHGMLHRCICMCNCRVCAGSFVPRYTYLQNGFWVPSDLLATVAMIYRKGRWYCSLLNADELSCPLHRVQKDPLMVF